MAVWTDQALYDRLWEAACRAGERDTAVYTRFLTPPEGELALALGKKAGTGARLWGGYPEAERRMCRFGPLEEEAAFPFQCLEITWAGKLAAPPGHRDLMGSVLGLGIERCFLGDLCLCGDRAYLFASDGMARLIQRQLESAGRTRVSARALKGVPPIPLPEGEECVCTVASLRLDSVLAGGLKTSRAKAAEAVRQGKVQVNHQETDRVDRLLCENDVISIRGAGRMRLERVGEPTRKDRLPLTLRRFGIKS